MQALKRGAMAAASILAALVMLSAPAGAAGQGSGTGSGTGGSGSGSGSGSSRSRPQVKGAPSRIERAVAGPHAPM